MRLGLRAAAKELGISHVALLKASTLGRVKREKDGSFDVEKCRASLEKNSNPEKQRQARTQQERPQKNSGEEDGDSYSEALRRREWLRVQKEELNLAKQRGELVEIAPINAWVAGMILKAREDLIRIAPELRDRLAQETDPIKCEQLVLGRIEQALNALAEYRK